jgi:hypothetical protein
MDWADSRMAPDPNAKIEKRTVEMWASLLMGVPGATRRHHFGEVRPAFRSRLPQHFGLLAVLHKAEPEALRTPALTGFAIVGPSSYSFRFLLLAIPLGVVPGPP